MGEIIKYRLLLKSILISFTVAALLTTQAAPAFADPAADAQAEVTAVNAQLNDVITRFDAANAELDKTQTAIDQKSAEITRTQADLGTAKANFAVRVKGLYKYGDVNVLEVVFGSKTINDLTERFDLLNRAGNSDAQMVKTITTSENSLEKTKADLEAARARQTALVDQIASDKASIESQVAAKKSHLADIEAQAAAQAAAQRAAADNSDSNSTPSVWGGSLPPASAGVVAIAEALIGVPYVYGGTSPDGGFDCSGLVWYCYAQIGISLNRTCDYTPNVSWDQLEPGDLVYSHGYGHVGIYIGGGMQIHAPYPGTCVQIGPVYSPTGDGYRP
jgi:peptidoglycan DL-endopeptidase CwlO